ncbi:hypothetical protein RHGRI_038935 [Rhododendron griersonianum]|uniref:Uncharacterized protein n=1 Tax=Rhododendron griersonianum TaxID=479676 RepID=A0AAV6HHU3_9ERIC|nr:hypothetical protein RHGRI_038935 [Rhododendron griersonianum]
METHPTEMSQGENDYAKDLQQLTYTVAGNIYKGAEKAESFFSSACIYRVPEDLRKLKERAYTPRLIAIGPLHREDEHLQTPLQHVKPSYTNYLLSRLAVGMEDQPELAKKTMFTSGFSGGAPPPLSPPPGAPPPLPLLSLLSPPLSSLSLISVFPPILILVRVLLSSLPDSGRQPVSLVWSRLLLGLKIRWRG